MSQRMTVGLASGLMLLPEEIGAMDHALVALGGVPSGEDVPDVYRFKTDDPNALRARIEAELGTELYRKMTVSTTKVG